MKNITTFLFVILLFTSIKAAAVLSDTCTVTVNESANDYVNIQKALSTKTQCKYLKVVLNGSFSINTLLHTTRSNTIIEFQHGAKLNIKQGVIGGILIQHDLCTVRNGIIVGSGVSTKDFYTGYGIQLFGVKNCKIIGCQLVRISGIGIFLCAKNKTGCDNNTVEGNKIINPAMSLGVDRDASAILLGYSGSGYSHKNNIIKNNYVDGNNTLNIGIGIIGHGANNIIENNYVANFTSYGIICYESQATDTSLTNNKILYNTVRNIGEIDNRETVKGMGIYMMKAIHSIVKGNKVYNTLRNSNQSETLGSGGITLSWAINSSVTDNIVDSSFMYGFVNACSFNTQYENNSVSNIRKSGMYFINVNDVTVESSTFKNIGEVVFKGHFENTSTPYIKAQFYSKAYRNKTTGTNIQIKNNKIYSSKNLLYFVGSDKQDNNNIINKVTNNTFTDNKIYGNRQNISQVIKYENGEKGNNFIRRNKIYQ